MYHMNQHHGHKWAFESGRPAENCKCGCHQHACASCGCGGSLGGYKKPHLKQMVFGAYKIALMKKVEAEIVRRRGDQLDETARDLVDIIEAKMKNKAETGKRLGDIIDRVIGQFEE